MREEKEISIKALGNARASLAPLLQPASLIEFPFDHVLPLVAFYSIDIRIAAAAERCLSISLRFMYVHTATDRHADWQLNIEPLVLEKYCICTVYLLHKEYVYVCSIVVVVVIVEYRKTKKEDDVVDDELYSAAVIAEGML